VRRLVCHSLCLSLLMHAPYVLRTPMLMGVSRLLGELARRGAALILAQSDAVSAFTTPQ
jgi:hypothetical protein